MVNFERPFGNFDFDKFLLDMKLKSSFVFFSFLGIVGIAYFVSQFNPFRNGDPNPQKDAALIQAILQGMNRLHFQPKQIDDNFSKQVYSLYLKDIDNGKRFFNKADIDQLKGFESRLDDEAGAGTFEFFDLSVTLMDKDIAKTQTWYREILSKQIDFSKNDMLETDGKKLDWAKTDEELRSR